MASQLKCKKKAEQDSNEALDCDAPKAARQRRVSSGGKIVKEFNVKYVNIVGASLAAYFLISMLVAAAMFRFKIGDMEMLIPVAFVMSGIILLWLNIIRRYPFSRRKFASALFLLLGLLAIILISIAYPILRTGALWEEPGDLGGAVIGIMIAISLVSQSIGFVAGFIPAAMFIRRIARTLEKLRIRQQQNMEKSHLIRQ